jgi:hypothetical protein
MQPKNEVKHMDDVVEALLVTWTITEPTAAQSQVLSKVRTRTRKVFEKIFNTQPIEVIECCVRVWAVASEATEAAIFDCVDSLTPSAQRVVALLCEIVTRQNRVMTLER